MPPRVSRVTPAAAPRLAEQPAADATGQAVSHLSLVLNPLGQYLAGLGVGLPFDPLSMGYNLGRDVAGSVRVLRRLVAETEACRCREPGHVTPVGAENCVTGPDQRLRGWPSSASPSLTRPDMIARYGPRTRLRDACSGAELAGAAGPLRRCQGRRDPEIDPYFWSKSGAPTCVRLR
jgi:hypothetical protein